MKKIIITTENELRMLFNDSNKKRAFAGDSIFIADKITLSSDLIIDVPVKIYLTALSGNIEQQGYSINVRKKNNLWQDGAYVTIEHITNLHA